MTWEEYNKIGNGALTNGKVVSKTEIFRGESITYEYNGYLVCGDKDHFHSIKHSETGIVHTEKSFIRGIPGSSSDGKHFQIDLTYLSDVGVDTLLQSLKEEKKLREADKLRELNERLDELVRTATYLSGTINLMAGGPFSGTTISLKDGVKFVKSSSTPSMSKGEGANGSADIY